MSKISSYRILLYSLCITAILILAGCADDLRNRSLFDCGAGEAVISYSVADVILTRDGEGEDFESKIDHAYLLFYASDATVRTDVPVAAVRAENDAANPGTLKFKMPLNLNPNTDYQLVAIANADSYTPSGFDNYESYLDYWKNNISSTEYTSLKLECASQINNSMILPMSGELKDKQVFRFSMGDGGFKISSSLSFRRKVARIDVANLIKQGFNVEAVLLCNYRDAVDIYPSENIGVNTFVTLHSVLSEESESEKAFIPMPVADDDGIQRLFKELYCFPSVSYDSYMGDKVSTALIIKAKFGQDAVSSYYRINVGSDGNVSEVKANTKYLITIKSVKGRGASTPEEAYAAKESPIVLSVVEDWDLDGSNFAMDDKGNFIVVSSSKFEFEGDDIENREVKVLTSKGLDWSVTYVPDNEESSDAFIVSQLSGSFAISPVEKNTGSYPFSGKCVVSASTSEGEELSVTIPVTQQFKPYEPEIPDMDFTILPVNGDRVKIDHDKKIIEIDAFDPDCFNSFIDIPFKAYIKPGSSVKTLVIQSADLKWPQEGAISMKSIKDYYYCASSFATSTIKVFSGTKGKEEQASNVVNGNVLIGVGNGNEFYISVGAMAPDDPSINRTIRIYDQYYNKYIDYDLIIKPSPVIIDDVIINDDHGNLWLIFDRNIQEVSSFESAIGLNADVRKYQAYNYTSLYIPNNSHTIGMPSKFIAQNTPMYEDHHTLYRGITTSLSEKDRLQSTNEDQSSSLKYKWLDKYKCSDEQSSIYPFYDDSIFEKWQFPSDELLRQLASKIRVSKMRMFLVSEVPVKNGKNKIQICCYWPFQGNNVNVDLSETPTNTYGYFASNESGELEKIVCLYCDNTKIATVESNNSNAAGMSRLIRPLTEAELNNYKQNYLGYGSQPHKLILCHPDTYTSDGWIPY